jgi:hypothetical protein
LIFLRDWLRATVQVAARVGGADEDEATDRAAPLARQTISKQRHWSR